VGVLEVWGVARRSETPRRAAAAFDPGAWTGEISRHLDVARCAESLGDAVASAALWSTPATDSETRRAVAAPLAATLKETTPLYEITAMLIAPWLFDRPPAPPTGAAESPPAGAGFHAAEHAADGDRSQRLATVTDRLVTAMRYLFDAPGDLKFDPWLELVQWVWSHLTAWAVPTLQREFGIENVRGLPAGEYQRLLAATIQRTDAAALRERAGQLLLTYAQELAKAVVATLALEEIAAARLALFLGLAPLATPTDLLPAPRPTPLASDVLAAAPANDHLAVMSSAHYHAVREALYKNTFARVEGNPWPTAQLARGELLGQAQLRPPGADGRARLSPRQVEVWARAMWEQRGELSDLDADALDALSALWLEQARLPQDRAVADVDTLLTMRGIKPRMRAPGKRSGFQTEQRAEIQRALTHIQNLWITIARAELPADDPATDVPGSGGRKTLDLQSRAFVITDRLGVTDETGNMIDLQKFVFSPGQVFAYFLMGPGQQTALLSARALRYDPYRQTWEKRLARFLSWQWRLHASGELAQPYRVGDLLDAAGKTVHSRWPARTRERLEQALDRLGSDGVIAAWEYADWDEEVAAQPGWAAVWRDAVVLIAPPEAVVHYYREGRQAVPAPALPAPLRELPESPADLAGLIRDHRRRLGVSQHQVALILGVSQAYVSKLERGKIAFTPSATLRSRLLDWLTTDLPV
jgi:DNA-binding XRE family transcriptional regulator